MEDCNKDPCVRLFFAGCYLVLPREKGKPDIQAKPNRNLTPYAKQTVLTAAIRVIQLSKVEEEYYLISSFIIFLFPFYNILIITQVLLERRLQDAITSAEGAGQSPRQAPVRLY